MDELKEFQTWARDVVNFDKPGDLETDSPALKIFKEAHMRYRQHWTFPDDFPNAEVLKAFATPVVDLSKEKFSWAEPDPEAITALLTRKAG